MPRGPHRTEGLTFFAENVAAALIGGALFGWIAWRAGLYKRFPPKG